MIWHLAVHPDYRNGGIGTALLSRATEIAAKRGVVRLEAWTRDDPWVQSWYQSRGFRAVDSYLHVFIDGAGELKGAVKSEIPGLLPVQAFAHYVGRDPEAITRRFRRVHRCVLHELRIL
ncbi:MAG: GNAT family N-acetyltransferase [Bacillota bacterium]|jgi:ribosomal protein S18 acetylase RimI-like enzyme|nr:GNAT family N-acetyltransferase [Candidatus Fermentithermobacillaceae bacterium]